MKKFLVLALLCLSSLAYATTTVTGHLSNLSGTSAPLSYVRFWLRGCSGNQPRITGTGAIAPTAGPVWYVDLPADNSGNVSGTLYSTRDAAGTGNGEIECGGSYTAVWYGMQIFQNGKAGPEIPVHAKSGAALDISNVTPITTNPVATSPTGDTTYLRVDGGNSPLTGPISAKKLNAIRFADQFSGASVTEKVDAAIADCGPAQCLIVIPSTMASGNPTSIPNNTILLDLRGSATGVIPLDGAMTINGQTPGVWSMLRLSQTKANPDRSWELQTNVLDATGDFTNANTQSLEASTFDARAYGAITNVPASLFIVGGEGVARSWLVTTGAVIPWGRAIHGGCLLDGGNGGFTACTDYYAKQADKINGATGTITSAYGYVAERQIAATTNNYSSWMEGNLLFNDGSTGGINFDWCLTVSSIADCATKLTWQTVDSSRNIVHYTLGGAEEWRVSAGSNPWLKFSSPYVDIDPNGAGYVFRAKGGLVIGSSATASGVSTGAGSSNPNNLVANSLMPFGTTVSVGGSSVPAGSCTDTSVTVTGATTAMTLLVSPAGALGSNWSSFSWSGYISATNTGQVHICNSAAGALTPSTLTFNVRVVQ